MLFVEKNIKILQKKREKLQTFRRYNSLNEYYHKIHKTSEFIFANVCIGWPPTYLKFLKVIFPSPPTHLNYKRNLWTIPYQNDLIK